MFTMQWTNPQQLNDMILQFSFEKQKTGSHQLVNLPTEYSTLVYLTEFLIRESFAYDQH